MEQLGRQIVREMRLPLDEGRGPDDAPRADDPATDGLRWGGEDFDDEEIWTAFLGAVDEASTEGELWRLGDGFVDESVRTRPALYRRLIEHRRRNKKVQALYRAMSAPEDWGVVDDGEWTPGL